MFVGSRVCVRLSIWTKVLTPPHHWDSLDGQTGKITNAFCALEDKSQMFTVDFDRPVKLGANHIVRRSFSVMDLVPEEDA